jgi:hypothetical protein
MGIIEKTKNFLTIGACAGLVAFSPFMVLDTVGDIAPHGTKVDEGRHYYRLTDRIKNGVDTISYKLFDKAITQPTEIYRYNVMEYLMGGRKSYFSFISSDSEDKMIAENLKKAKELGVFKDAETFKAEVALIEKAAKVEKINDRIFVEDNGIIDITDPSHFQGIKNLEQVKKRVSQTLASLREDSSLDENNKLKM